MRFLIPVAAALALTAAACQPGAPTPATETPDAAVPDAAPGEQAGVWLDANGPGETGLVYRDSEGASAFAMVCRQQGALFTASAPMGTLGADQIPPDVTIFLGATAIPAKSRISAASPAQVGAEAVITPDLLKALAAAPGVRIVMGETFVEGGPDTTGKFAAFANNCGQLSGVSPAP
jgi:hypothetical protein